MFAKMFEKTKRRKTHGVTVRCLKVTADARGYRNRIKKKYSTVKYITHKKLRKLLLSFADSGVMIVGCLAENWNEWVSESENLAHVGTCLKCLELVILTLEKCIFYGFIFCMYLGGIPNLKFTSIRGGPLCYPQCFSSGKSPLSGSGPRIEPGTFTVW
jgi:hypothetical protein